MTIYSYFLADIFDMYDGKSIPLSEVLSPANFGDPAVFGDIDGNMNVIYGFGRVILSDMFGFTGRQGGTEWTYFSDGLSDQSRSSNAFTTTVGFDNDNSYRCRDIEEFTPSVRDIEAASQTGPGVAESSYRALDPGHVGALMQAARSAAPNRALGLYEQAIELLEDRPAGAGLDTDGVSNGELLSEAHATLGLLQLTRSKHANNPTALDDAVQHLIAGEAHWEAWEPLAYLYDRGIAVATDPATAADYLLRSFQTGAARRRHLDLDGFSSETIAELQRRLEPLGLYDSGADGVAWPKLLEVVASLNFRCAAGMEGPCLTK
jgi:hypothetical protein